DDARGEHDPRRHDHAGRDHHAGHEHHAGRRHETGCEHHAGRDRDHAGRHDHHRHEHHRPHTRAAALSGPQVTTPPGTREGRADTVPAMPVTPTASTYDADVAVVGAGAAGLYAALCAARAGADVVLVSATPLAQTASYWAQGGLAAALAADDSFELHLADTERAGRGLVRRSAAEVLVHEAPARVADLQALGVRFDADRFGRLALGLEGGHSVRRVVHAGGSATGRRVVRQLSALAAEDARIMVLEGARARALWVSDGRCRGLVCDGRLVLARRAVLLSTGGAAALWERTTNPPGS